MKQIKKVLEYTTIGLVSVLVAVALASGLWLVFSCGSGCTVNLKTLEVTALRTPMPARQGGVEDLSGLVADETGRFEWIEVRSINTEKDSKGFLLLTVSGRRYEWGFEDREMTKHFQVKPECLADVTSLIFKATSYVDYGHRLVVWVQDGVVTEIERGGAGFGPECHPR